MADAKHTQGPWRLSKRATCFAITGGNVLVATCAGEPANATLIAAAPELLERLEELLEYSDHLKGSAVHKRCLDAIAKATGARHG